MDSPGISHQAQNASGAGDRVQGVNGAQQSKDITTTPKDTRSVQPVIRIDESIMFSISMRNRISAAIDEYDAFWERQKPRLEKELGLDLAVIDRIGSGRVQNWDTLQDDLRRAADANEGNERKGTRAAIGRKIRFLRNKMALYAPSMKAWMSVFPQDSQYASVLCGAFKLVLTATATASTANDMVLQCIEEIPKIIQEAKRYINLYAPNPELVRPMCEIFGRMYVQILDVFRWIFTWLGERGWSTAIKATLKQERYAAELEELIKGVKDEAASLNNQSIFALAVTVVNMSKVHESKRDETIQLCMKTMQKELDRHNLLTVEEMQRMLDAKQENMERQWAAYASQLAGGLLMFESTQKAILNCFERQKAAQSSLPPGSSQYIMSSDEMLFRLGYDHDELRSSLNQARSVEAQLTPREQEYAKALLENPALLNWMTTQSSTCLYVNGTAETFEDDDVEPSITLASSAIVTLLSEWHSSSISVLYAFCKYDDSVVPFLSGLQGLGPSLVCQLLQQKPGLEVSGEAAMQLRAGNFNLENFCNVLSHLLWSLPAGENVFIVIDNIQSYVVADQDGLGYLLDAVKTLVQAREIRATVKLLVTNPLMRSRGKISNIFREQTVTLGELDYEDQGYSISQWHSRSSRPVQHSSYIMSAGAPQLPFAIESGPEDGIVFNVEPPEKTVEPQEPQEVESDEESFTFQLDNSDDD